MNTRFFSLVVCWQLLGSVCSVMLATTMMTYIFFRVLLLSALSHIRGWGGERQNNTQINISPESIICDEPQQENRIFIHYFRMWGIDNWNLLLKFYHEIDIEFCRLSVIKKMLLFSIFLFWVLSIIDNVQCQVLFLKDEFKWERISLTILVSSIN